LPAQRELSASYGVTLVTLRRALAVLERDGLVSQQPGKGTFVTEPRAAYQLGSLRGFAEDLHDQGHTVGTEVLSQALRRTPSAVAGRFGLPTDGRALRVERIRLLSGRPAVHQVSWVFEPAASQLVDADLSGTSLYAVVTRAGVAVRRATEALRPGLLDGPTAALLRQSAGAAVFVSERVTYGPDDTPVVLDRAVILGSTMEIRTERAAAGVSVLWSRPPAARDLR
jgi:GntR family transcriptional regulator